MDEQTNPDYSFLNQENPSSGGFLASASKQQRILMVVAGGGVLLVVISLLLALIFGGGDDARQNLTVMAQSQQEIIRISEIGEESARSQQMLSLATTTKLSMSSAQKKVTSSVSRKGASLESATLQLRENQTTTSELASAEQANRFDETFAEILRSELVAYQQLLESTYDIADATDQQMLEELFIDVTILLDTLEEI